MSDKIIPHLVRKRPYPLPNAIHAFLLEHHSVESMPHPFLVFPNFIAPPRSLLP